MFFSSITDRGAAPALVKTLAFNEARLKMIAENVANANTPNYRTKQLDLRAFQASLRDALDRRATDPMQPLRVNSGQQVQSDRHGYLTITPNDAPPDTALYHDGTNFSIEREMADLAETAMSHQLATSLLNRRYEGLRRAIRGV